MKIVFGARVIISNPDEGNEDYQGRTGLMVREITANSVGLKSYQVAFEDEALQPRFYGREIVVEQPKPPRVVTETRHLPASRAQVKAAAKHEAVRALRRALDALEAE